MNGFRAISDQLYMWSAIDAEQICCQPATTTQNAIASISSARRGAAGFAHRTLQALWQTRVQVCSRSGARPQVLSIVEPCWCASRDGLHTAKRPTSSGAVSTQLPANPRHPGRVVCDQSGVAAPAREILSLGRERHDFCVYRPARHGSRCCPDRQHARSRAGGRRPGLTSRGGDR